MHYVFRLPILFVVLPYVAGCGPTAQQIQEQQEQAAIIAGYHAEDAARIRYCVETYPEGKRDKSNVVQFAQCLIDAANHLHFKIDDLEYSLAYKRLALAEEFEAGKITQGEFASQLSQYHSEIITQRQMRADQARIAAANERAARAAACAVAQQKSANDRAERANNNNGSNAAALGAFIDAFVDSSNEVDACK